MRIFAIALIFLTVCSPAVNAEAAPPSRNYQNVGAEVGLIENSTLTVFDNVVDNCWTNSSAIRSKVHLIFEQNDIRVLDYKPAFFSFDTVSTELSAVGFKISGGCAVSAEFRVQTGIYSDLGGANGRQVHVFRYRARIFDRASIFSNGGNTNSQLTDFFEGAASEFVAKTLSARRDQGLQEYMQEYPSTKEPPMSKKEWDEYIATLPSSSN